MKRLLIILSLIFLSVSLQGQVIRAMPFYNPTVASSPYGPELCTDPTMDDAGDWICTGGWSISGGTAHCTSGDYGSVTMVATPIVTGKTYHLVYTLTCTASYQIPYVGSAGCTMRTTSGTFTQDIVAGAGNALIFSVGESPNQVIDNVSLKEVL